MAGQSHFISQSDIHASKSVFQELYHFSTIRGGNRQCLLYELLIKENRYFSASRSDATDYFGNVAGSIILIAGIDALRRLSEKEVAADIETRFLKDRQHHLPSRTRIGRTLEYNQLSRPYVSPDGLNCCDNVGQIGILVLSQRGGHTDIQSIHLLRRRKRLSRSQSVGRNSRKQSFTGDIRNIRDAGINRIDSVSNEIDTGHLESRPRHFQRQWQSDIPKTDHAHFGRTVANLLF